MIAAQVVCRQASHPQRAEQGCRGETVADKSTLVIEIWSTLSCRFTQVQASEGRCCPRCGPDVGSLIGGVPLHSCGQSVTYQTPTDSHKSRSIVNH